jgi:hypothetical protein
LSEVKERLTYANVMATAAVFIALGGGAYAASIAKHSVGTKQLKNDAVVSAKVKDGSLAAHDFARDSLPRGETGPQGETGPAGSPDTPAQVRDKLATVDGAGSGLDADSLDGQDSPSFVRGADSVGGAQIGGTYAVPILRPESVGPRTLNAAAGYCSLQSPGGAAATGSCTGPPGAIATSHPSAGTYCMTVPIVPLAMVVTIDVGAVGLPVAYTSNVPATVTAEGCPGFTFVVVTYDTAVPGGAKTDEPFYVFAY